MSRSLAAYPKASILRGITIPEAGGDTLWANGETAYDGLPEPLRQLVNTLWAVHSNDYDYAATLAAAGATAEASETAKERTLYHKSVFASTIYETEHPVVRVHPVSGQRSLLLGHFVKRFVGLSEADRPGSSTFCKITSPSRRTPCAGAGSRATWPSGTTAARSTAPLPISACNAARCAAPRWPVTCRWASMAARAARRARNAPPAASRPEGLRVTSTSAGRGQGCPLPVRHFSFDHAKDTLALCLLPPARPACRPM
jgi:hypothetical protein